MLHFELTADDYVAANSLNARWTAARWLRVGLIAAVLLALALWRMPDSPSRALTFVASYAAVLTLLMLSYRFAYLPWRARRVFAMTKALQRPYSWTWDQERLCYKTDLANGIVPWTNLASWRENETLFALYASPIAFFLLPKRAFASAAEVETFRAMLRAKVMPAPPPEAAF